MVGFGKFLLAATLAAGSCDELSTAYSAKSTAAVDSSAQAPEQTSTPVVESAPLTAKETAAARGCSRLESAPARGLSCLHCMQPIARTQSLEIVDVMVSSCVKNVVTNYLVDGTFGFDAGIVVEHARRLTQGGRSASMVFYLTNGASQRKWRSTPIVSFGTKTEPSAFRRLIKTDSQTQSEFRELAKRLVPLLTQLRALGVNLYVAIGLEDNLDRFGFDVMLDLAQAEIPGSLGVRFVRSPCPGCASGNDSSVPRGVLLELHKGTGIVRNGIVSNDGLEYYVKGIDPETAFAKGGKASTTLTRLAEVQYLSNQRNNMFILWSGRRQGVDIKSYKSGSNRHPSQRRYATPSSKEKSLLVGVLRSNL